MKKETDFQQTLSYIYNSTFVPIHYYRNDELILSYPVLDTTRDLTDTQKRLLRQNKKDLVYFSTKEALHIGYIRNHAANEEVILGPVTSTPLTDEALDSLMLEYGIFLDQKPKIREYFQQMPLFSLTQFLNIIALVNKEMTGELIEVFHSFDILGKEEEKRVDEKSTGALYERKEAEVFHDTYFFEQEYYGCVERGDLARLEHLIKNVPAFNEGQIGYDSLRQAKNIFIASITMTTRHAITGGLDIETAYELSDSYIQEAERMTDAQAVNLLNATAITDFTRRVAENKIPMNMQADIYRAMQFISNHVNQNITVEDVADFLGIDRSTLSRKFKQELGFNVKSYIMRRKLEEARSLLRYTDKTISEISEYLCFSTQSYFQNVFKKKYGQTPKEYRLSEMNRVSKTE
ncbi:MAG: helix-turn-helix domain-containing protein [Lachnospiraceae bacterium]|nr:helix-turn-helix domain-containing protein [Lachnospiraceae bacterium]